MQAFQWFAQSLISSWFLAFSLVFLAVGTATYEEGKFPWWGALAPPTFALAYVVCPEIPIWYGLIAGAIGITVLGYVFDAREKVRGFETKTVLVLGMAASVAWLPWIVSGLAVVGLAQIRQITSVKLETSLFTDSKNS